MDHDFENPLEPSSSSSSSSSPSSSRDEKVDEEFVNDLLEECWFFDNLFKTKPRMLRSYSDPCCPPSKISQEISTENSDSQTITEKKNKIQRNLIRSRAPKMEENQEKKENSKLTREHLIQPASSGKKEASTEKEGAAGRQFSRSKLQRTPSLPSYFGREDNNESDARMSTLIQEAFDTTSAILPKPYSSKGLGLTRSYSISRYRPPRKSPSDLPGLQEKINREGLKRENSRRAYLSEAWLSQKSAPPPVPNWASKSSSEDMKAQIKFWARAVASNVRQEC